MSTHISVQNMYRVVCFRLNFGHPYRCRKQPFNDSKHLVTVLNIRMSMKMKCRVEFIISKINRKMDFIRTFTLEMGGMSGTIDLICIFFISEFRSVSSTFVSFLEVPDCNEHIGCLSIFLQLFSAVHR